MATTLRPRVAQCNINRSLESGLKGPAYTLDSVIRICIIIPEVSDGARLKIEAEEIERRHIETQNHEFVLQRCECGCKERFMAIRKNQRFKLGATSDTLQRSKAQRRIAMPRMEGKVQPSLELHDSPV
jgi:hypothetical protein